MTEALAEKGIKLYSNRAIGIATYFGGPIAAGILVRRNFINLGNAKYGKYSLYIGILSTILLFIGLFSIPEDIINQIPNVVIPVIYTAIIFAIVNRLQGKDLKKHKENKGEFYSAWKAFGIGAINMGIIMVSFIIYIIIITLFSVNTVDPNINKVPTNVEYKAKYVMPKQLKVNDKIIIIENANYSLIRQVVIDFTKTYDNLQQYKIKPISKIWKINNTKTIITFPCDIDFELFCYYINYLKYPINIKYSPKITAWTTAKSSDNWLTSDFEDKKVMMFLDPYDMEYDNVMITTEDNYPYKISFAVGKGLSKVKNIIYEYQKCEYNNDSIKSVSNETIK
ncbi:MAG: hypothetical protein HY951_09100 [Bacteroidia bacterium]|nr:hypothetical protein [Bacteroidia bacterium]